jgi:hypothetical protein
MFSPTGQFLSQIRLPGADYRGFGVAVRYDGTGFIIRAFFHDPKPYYADRASQAIQVSTK